jgi:hypothetical protein
MPVSYIIKYLIFRKIKFNFLFDCKGLFYENLLVNVIIYRSE